MITRRSLLKIGALSIATLFAGPTLATASLNNGSYSVIQIPGSTTTRETMFYVVTTPQHGVIVIDGGMYSDSWNVERFINDNFGGHVDYWILTHAHDNHVGALTEIIERRSLNIGAVLHDLPEWWFTYSYEGHRLEAQSRYERAVCCAIKDNYTTFERTRVGTIADLCGVRLQVLSGFNPEFHVNAVNNSSLVFSLECQGKKIIFLADMGQEGGWKLENIYGSDLKADMVQMAHHGRFGVGPGVYDKIHASVGFWPCTDYICGDNGAMQCREFVEVERWVGYINYDYRFYANKSGDFKRHYPDVHLFRDVLVQQARNLLLN